MPGAIHTWKLEALTQVNRTYEPYGDLHRLREYRGHFFAVAAQQLSLGHCSHVHYFLPEHAAAKMLPSRVFIGWKLYSWLARSCIVSCDNGRFFSLEKFSQR